MKMTRREFVKNNAIAATATAAGVTIPGMKEVMAASDGIRRPVVFVEQVALF